MFAEMIRACSSCGVLKFTTVTRTGIWLTAVLGDLLCGSHDEGLQRDGAVATTGDDGAFALTRHEVADEANLNVLLEVRERSAACLMDEAIGSEEDSADGFDVQGLGDGFVLR